MHALRLRVALALVAAVLTAGALVVILSGGGHSSVARQPTAGMLNQPQIQAMRCRDWQRLDVTSQARVLAGLRAILGGQVVGQGASGRGSVLGDAQARRLFNGYCRPRFAKDFSLYKLYGQAAGFVGQP
jgi:hypothetical protein